ncbi:hypothetical protein [Parvularcula sp. LCG005]|uniref:hypothetical protein n=1 Tax=Parvularcula sp. LCG005 TaxID=3078805 RepID=UPI002942C4B0|nr:hypothetical protein [Parvularcula sp. LCG005]WOI52129.1 hypothetical protein RUI03_08160 [Parvularcula sp. LCG005]
MSLAALLVLAAAGRFHAEANVRQSERELQRLADAREALQGDVDRVRLDVEVLENAGRLSELNAQHLALRTVRSEQIADDRDFARVVGIKVPEKPSAVPQNADIIGNAIGMNDLSAAERAVQ